MLHCSTYDTDRPAAAKHKKAEVLSRYFLCSFTCIIKPSEKQVRVSFNYDLIILNIFGVILESTFVI